MCNNILPIIFQNLLLSLFLPLSCAVWGVFVYIGFCICHASVTHSPGWVWLTTVFSHGGRGSPRDGLPMESPRMATESCKRFTEVHNWLAISWLKNGTQGCWTWRCLVAIKGGRLRANPWPTKWLCPNENGSPFLGGGLDNWNASSKTVACAGCLGLLLGDSASIALHCSWEVEEWASL